MSVIQTYKYSNIWANSDNPSSLEKIAPIFCQVLASALLLASGTTGLAALQSLSIAMGGVALCWVNHVIISSIFSQIFSLHCWGRVASSKIDKVITFIFSILFAISSLKGVIYAVLITVACFSLQQGLNSTLTGMLGTKKNIFSESVGYFRWPQKVWFNCSLPYSSPAPALCHRTLFTTLSQQC